MPDPFGLPTSEEPLAEMPEPLRLTIPGHPWSLISPHYTCLRCGYSQHLAPDASDIGATIETHERTCHARPGRNASVLPLWAYVAIFALGSLIGAAISLATFLHA
jgi:hypothetical protein